jgi:hypothetical protein
LIISRHTKEKTPLNQLSHLWEAKDLPRGKTICNPSNSYSKNILRIIKLHWENQRKARGEIWESLFNGRENSWGEIGRRRGGRGEEGGAIFRRFLKDFLKQKKGEDKASPAKIKN